MAYYGFRSLNHDTEDYGTVAMAIPRNYTFATCSCGHIETNKKKDVCKCCELYLEWRSVSRNQAESIINTHRKRHKENPNLPNRCFSDMFKAQTNENKRL